MDGRALDERMRELAAGQYSLVGRAQLRDLGASRHAAQRRLRSPDWEPVTPQVLRLAGASVAEEQWAMAAVLEAGPGAVLSHRSAAAAWGIPGFALRPVELSRPRSSRGRATGSGRVHHPLVLPAHHHTVRRGLPGTTLARTV